MYFVKYAEVSNNFYELYKVCRTSALMHGKKMRKVPTTMCIGSRVYSRLEKKVQGYLLLLTIKCFLKIIAYINLSYIYERF